MNNNNNNITYNKKLEYSNKEWNKKFTNAQRNKIIFSFVKYTYANIIWSASLPWLCNVKILRLTNTIIAIIL